MTEGLVADFASHHIEGIAIHGETPFRVPLISHVVGNLWQGGCIDSVALPAEFRHVLSLYPWERYLLPPGCERREARLYDSSDVPPADALYELAAAVNEMCEDGQTLVHCQAGLNRSGLLAGLALVLRGIAPADAIALLRGRRCDAVLCNRSFEAWLLEQAPGQRAAA